MREPTTTSSVDYFNLPGPLWRKRKKCLPKKERKMSTKGGRPRASDRAVINAPTAAGARIITADLHRVS